ncbi:transcription termination/antitermination protein NusG [Ochrobactrum sp. EDr1-4]|uniref:transcription termination/antitermination protein NusG n=1 Tax=Ochrobactrum sp. EDr1-4 TaxID=3368622 RepID=UPI003BA1AB39
MMAIDQRQIDHAIASAPSEEHCRAIDKVLAERRRIERMRSAAAIRMSDDSPWLIIRVSGNELSIRDAMLAAGVEVNVPMKMGKERRRRNEKIPAQPEPVLVGYILARCNIVAEALAGLLTFTGTVSILGGYENPFLMSAEKAKQFNEKAEKGEFDHERPATLFVGVKKVKIIEGPFAGKIGDVVSSIGVGKGTAVIEIDLFGRPVPMIMPLAFLSRL